MNKCWLTTICIIGLVLSPVVFGWNDSDKDGVPDTKDACPNTPSGVLVDASGCDKSRLFKKVCLTTTDDKVFPETCIEATELVLNFEFAKTEILYSQWQILAQIKQFLQLNDVKLCLIGHTDSVGSEKANQSLSEARAKKVMGLLVEDYGFDPGRFIVRGMGTRFPISTNDTQVGRALNRRVNFVVESDH
ncbi:OmpA family [Shewanella psychrophila]|uniref:OmpA family n=1 Tax=Shewanella psychrophila TaxID=225848 RepID=A0A1S6HPP5_9GAMM|nr:OmpA family protein [Shewanella psychrophila]AQS37487.1 OmpA family [Shewanella psychrophila]